MKLTSAECCDYSFERETFKTDLHIPCSYTGHKCLYHCAQPLRSRSLKIPGGMEAFRVVLLFKLATWTKRVAAEIHKSCKVPKSSYCIGTHLQFFTSYQKGLAEGETNRSLKHFIYHIVDTVFHRCNVHKGFRCVSTTGNTGSS